jgi:hypothetical protein
MLCGETTPVGVDIGRLRDALDVNQAEALPGTSGRAG